MRDSASKPGTEWLEIVSRPTVMEFARAFSPEPILEATVVANQLRGTLSIYDFFCTTRSMYERIAFVQEMRCDTRICLEWEGVFLGKAISGATILAYGPGGVIDRVRLFHYPIDQLNAFSADFARRRALKI